MNHLKFFKNITKSSVDIAGGKGASLGEMTRLFDGQANNPIPPGFVVLANAFDRFIEETNLKEEIVARLKEVNPADMNSVDKASNVLRDVIHDTPMPKDLEEEILKSFDELGAEYVAVRSSATAEDSSIASWAGELETYLNTTREDVLMRVRECWSSLFTPRAIFYRHEKGLIDSHVAVAVVVQKMIQSEISGIAFTVHPVTEDRNQMIIEAGFGLGEAIVGGQVTPDSYVISKRDMAIMDIMIGGQTKKLIRKLGNKETGKLETDNSIRESGLPAREALPRMAGGSVDPDITVQNEWIELSKEEGERQKLTGRQIIELAELCKKIENHYAFPCDIEWAFEGGKFYVTQSRPITTLKNT